MINPFFEKLAKLAVNHSINVKIGGTIHVALGSGFNEVGVKNESVIRWDILKDMKKPGSKIIADDRGISEEGIWNI